MFSKINQMIFPKRHFKHWSRLKVKYFVTNGQTFKKPNRKSKFEHTMQITPRKLNFRFLSVNTGLSINGPALIT